MISSVQSSYTFDTFVYPFLPLKNPTNVIVHFNFSQSFPVLVFQEEPEEEKVFNVAVGVATLVLVGAAIGVGLLVWLLPNVREGKDNLDWRKAWNIFSKRPSAYQNLDDPIARFPDSELPTSTLPGSMSVNSMSQKSSIVQLTPSSSLDGLASSNSLQRAESLITPPIH